MDTLARSAVVCGALALLGGVAGAGDWPQFLGPDRNGVSAETGLIQSWPKEGPPVVWEKRIGEGYSGVAVSGGAAVVFYRSGGDEVVECLGAADGKPRWTHATPTKYRDRFGKGNGPRSTPLIDGKFVYTLGAEGRLQCLDLESGKPAWEKNLAEDYRVPPNYFGVGTTPLVEGKLLLLNVGGKQGAGIVAFDKETGKEAWKATDDPASYSSPVAVTVDGVRDVVFFTREGLVALDPENGSLRAKKRWRAAYDASVNAATPLLLDGHVFLTASYETGAVLLKLKKDGVSEVWSNDESLSAHYTTPVRQGDFLYGCDGRQEQGARLRCVEWKTGKVRWTKEGFGCASLLLADGNIFALTEDGDLVLVEATPDGYKEKARAAELTGPCRAPLALADGRLYGRDDRKVVCWNVAAKK